LLSPFAIAWDGLVVGWNFCDRWFSVFLVVGGWFFKSGQIQSLTKREGRKKPTAFASFLVRQPSFTLEWKIG
jgi:hypothetical protein